MKLLIPDASTNYRLLDSGNGMKLEQFGSNTIIRPDSNCLWQQYQDDIMWNNTQARYAKNKQETWQWVTEKSFKEPWLFSYHLPHKGPDKGPKITCQLRFATSKNIGIFPEQASNWSWMVDKIKSVRYNPQVLNLFGYTGAASLVAAAAGAEVCHVDASQAAVTWARNNQKLSKLDNSSIRWIVDDCAKFVAREIKREMQYDALIIDPPAFGRDTKGKVFEFERNILALLELCTKVLKPEPLFVIFNGYAMGHSATVLRNILQDFFPDQAIEFGELHLQEFGSKRTMPCSIFARFART